jgi:RNA polymerase sigma-70 factor (ECF subfamily)
MTGAVKSLEQLFARHSRGLQAFFRRRIRARSEVDDLTQEVYLRMLRISEAEVIHNPEAYLYTVASHLVQEHALGEKRRASMADVTDPAVLSMLGEFSRLDYETDRDLRVRRLSEVLRQLPPNCHAAVVMAYRHEMPYEEIAAQLGVSVSMVKKYVKQALAHCRKRMARFS